jgi:hypothetical protein
LRASEPTAYRPGSPVVQLRVPKDTLARIDHARGDDTRSAWVLRLIDRELTGPQPALVPAGTAPITSPAGEPCPGVACSGPGCWNRDTARYGLRRLVLCTACAALQGQTYKREIPESAAPCRPPRRRLTSPSPPGTWPPLMHMQSG